MSADHDVHRSDREPLRNTLLAHHPIARSETGLLAGCRCGEVQLGEDVIQHVMEKLLDGPLAPWLDAAFAVHRAEALAEELDQAAPEQERRTAAQVKADELMDRCDDDRNYDDVRLELARLYAAEMRCQQEHS
jgi:hypothetical protein